LLTGPCYATGVDDSTAPPDVAPIENALRDDLMAGERVLWHGVPDPKYLNRAFAMWLFAVPWTAFALGWTGIALTVYLSTFNDTTASWARAWGWIMPLFGTPFIAVGGWMLYQPIRLRAEAGRTVHVLTDRRLLSVTTGRARTSKSVDLAKLGPVTIKEHANGWGDLSVETGSSVDSDGDRRTDRFEMTGVPDVTRLKKLLLEGQLARV
jgi:hypothetical protein